MTTGYIEKLIEKFFNGDTSLEEEKAIYTYFSGENIPSHLQKYRDLFCDFSMLPLQSQKKKRQKIFHLKWYAGVAASILLAATVIFSWNKYDAMQFNKKYDGSYVIVNGIRYSNVNSIRCDIETALAEADQLQQLTNANAIEAEAKSHILDGIENPEQRKVLEEILNDL